MSKGNKKMRERISRGKRIDNGEWIYWDRYGRITDINGEPTKTEIDIPTLLPYPTYISDLPIINDETVGDYTGLTDQKGKRIFEGDIVRYRPEYWCEPLQSVVEYCADKWNYPAFDLKDHDYEGNGLQFAHEEGVGLEVIGTVYDNPELLEVEE